MHRSDNMAELEFLAASQWGMFTTAQAQNLGMRRNQVARMVDACKVEPVCYGVYRYVAGAEPSQVDVKAAWMSVYPKKTAADRLSSKPFDAVLAGASAAFAFGAGDFHASPYTFITNHRKQTSRKDIRFLQCAIDDSDVVLVDGIPVTSFERTVYDLIRLSEDPDLIDGFMRDAARKTGHVFDLEKLGSLLTGLAPRHGFAAGDGRAFAADLIARNTAAYQVAAAGDSLKRALDAAARSVQKAMESNPAFEELRKTSSDLSKLYASAYPDLNSSQNLSAKCGSSSST